MGMGDSEIALLALNDVAFGWGRLVPTGMLNFPNGVPHKPAGPLNYPTGVLHKPARVLTFPAGPLDQSTGAPDKPAGVLNFPTGVLNKLAGALNFPTGVLNKPARTSTFTSAKNLFLRCLCFLLFNFLGANVADRTRGKRPRNPAEALKFTGSRHSGD